MYPNATSRHVPQPPAAPLAITEIEFCAWLSQAEPGEVLEYHKGFLALETVPELRRLSEPDRIELGRVARRAWWASENDLVHLLQRRCAPDIFSYLAISRPRPKDLPASLSSFLLKEVA